MVDDGDDPQHPRTARPRAGSQSDRPHPRAAPGHRRRCRAQARRRTRRRRSRRWACRLLDQHQVERRPDDPQATPMVRPPAPVTTPAVWSASSSPVDGATGTPPPSASTCSTSTAWESRTGSARTTWTTSRCTASPPTSSAATTRRPSRPRSTSRATSCSGRPNTPTRSDSLHTPTSSRLAPTSAHRPDRARSRSDATGKPTYIEGPYDNPRHVLRTLRRAVGRNGFHYTVTGGVDELRATA